VRWGNLALFVLPFGSTGAVAAKQNVPNAGRLRIIFLNVRWEKF